MSIPIDISGYMMYYTTMSTKTLVVPNACCPFCAAQGAEIGYISCPNPENVNSPGYRIKCFECGALGPFFEDLVLAFDAWNTRAGENSKLVRLVQGLNESLARQSEVIAILLRDANQEQETVH
jgi:hypothetical protein